MELENKSSALMLSICLNSKIKIQNYMHMLIGKRICIKLKQIQEFDTLNKDHYFITGGKKVVTK